MGTGLRKVYKKIGSDWIQSAIPFLREGDIFKMYEPDGKKIESEGKTIFKADKNPYQRSDGQWVIDLIVNPDDITA